MRLGLKPRTKLQQAMLQHLDSSSQLDPTPEFDFSIGWSDSYELLFLGEYSSTTAIKPIVDEAIKTGRVLISGRGGAAKTVIIRRLARHILESGNLASSA